MYWHNWDFNPHFALCFSNGFVYFKIKHTLWPDTGASYIGEWSQCMPWALGHLRTGPLLKCWPVAGAREPWDTCRISPLYKKKEITNFLWLVVWNLCFEVSWCDNCREKESNFRLLVIGFYNMEKKKNRHCVCILFLGLLSCNSMSGICIRSYHISLQATYA